ncbi:MAG: phosphatase PAP2 family protein [Chthoniobacterales bacterium]
MQVKPLAVTIFLTLSSLSLWSQYPASSPVPSPTESPLPTLASTLAPVPVPTPVASPWPLPPLDFFIQHSAPPPKPQSFRDRLDVQDVIARQGQLTQAVLDHVQWSYTFDVFSFSEVLGPNFNAHRYPKTNAFFKNVAMEANWVITGLKDHYQRLRPFQAYPALIHLYVRNEPGFGYPSGHTARSRLYAYILSYLDPAKRRAFLNSAEQVGVDRILAGEHYQTDLEAGRKLGKLLFYTLMKDPSFRQDLATLSAQEWPQSEPAMVPHSQ